MRICAIEVGEATARRYPYKPAIPLTVLVNPTLEYVGDETYDNNEGCLSVPDLRGDLRRHVRVRATAWDRHGGELVGEVAGLTAGTYQHEVDHLDGMIFVDRVEDPRTLSHMGGVRPPPPAGVRGADQPLRRRDRQLSVAQSTMSSAWSAVLMPRSVVTTVVPICSANST